MALKFRSRAQRPYLTGREHEVRPMTFDPHETAPQSSTLERVASAAGRLVFGGYFLYSGIHHFTDRDRLIDDARSKGVAWPKAAVLGSGALLVLGGLSMLTGVKQKAGASVVTTFLSGVTPANFTRNLAVLGGAAFAAASARRPRTAA